jgi:hypothetical protein
VAKKERRGVPRKNSEDQSWNEEEFRRGRTRVGEERVQRTIVGEEGTKRSSDIFCCNNITKKVKN